MKKHWKNDPAFRSRILLAAMLLMLSFLAVMLWRIQVAKGHIYEAGLERQSIRRVRLAGLRGRIFDRNGQAIADNRPNHCVAIYLEELRQPGSWDNTITYVQGLLSELSEKLQLEVTLDRDDVWNHIRKRLPLPLLAWRDLDTTSMARWAELAANTPGVDIYTESVRVYPFHKSACHVLGYVGRAAIQNDQTEPFHYYLPEMAGRSGVEKSQDEFLRGEVGGELVRVDVTGYRRIDPALAKLRKAPRSGLDIQLTIDMDLQQALEKSMINVEGAAVVVDPRNGDVLALVSQPGFDPNIFFPGISTKNWNELLHDPSKPLFNRAASGSYAPGSIFKPIVAVAALENQQAEYGATFQCPGYFEMSGITWRCAHRRAHGNIGFQDAIASSCNVFFYKLGRELGYDYTYHMAEALGLGRKTGIALAHEHAGILPNDRWMREHWGHGWRAGDTVNASIGQGAISVTPLQMALYTAALANGGTLHAPRLIAGKREPGRRLFEYETPKMAQDLNWSDRTVQLIRTAMRDVVMSEHGTGRAAAVPGVSMGGKTGTAEYGRKEDRKYRGWMIAFAPFESPRYAIAVVIDDARSGGSSAGPVIQNLFRHVFNRDRVSLTGGEDRG
jgi:penicillin-binding protein 2